MKRTGLKLVSLTIALALLLCCTVSSLAESETSGFTLRGGIKFGMTPEEIIEIEKSNGYEYTLTSKGDVLYDAGTCYNLYYGQSDSVFAYLGKQPIMRYEYDFDKANKRMYQFYYVFQTGKEAFDYLTDALCTKYGSCDPSPRFSTEKYADLGHFQIAHNCWSVPDGNNTVVIDLWHNDYGICFLSYQMFAASPEVDEQQSLDFSI